MNFSTEESNIINQYNYLASQIGIIDFKGKKYLKERINLENGTYKKDELSFTKWSTLMEGHVDNDLKLMGLNRDTNKLSDNCIKSLEFYKWKIYKIMDFKNSKDINELTNFIAKTDAEIIQKGGEISWDNYFFYDLERSNLLLGMDFTKTHDGIYERIIFDDIRVYQHKDNYKDLVRDLSIVLKGFFKKVISQNYSSTYFYKESLRKHLYLIIGIGDIKTKKDNPGDIVVVDILYDKAWLDIEKEMIK